LAYCKTEGIVLKRTDYSESSQIVTLFTRDFGRLRGIAKGAKRPRKGLPNTLDLLNRVDLVFLRKPPGQLHVFAEWTVIENFLRLRQNLDKLYSGLYVAELLYELTEESEESAALYALLLDTLRALATKDDALASVFLFEINLLCLLGHMPEVKKCVVCGRSLPARARFSPRDGGALCSGCHARGSLRLEVSRGALSALATLAQAEKNLVRRLKIGSTTRREIRSILSACMVELLGREPRTLRFLSSLHPEDVVR
jgi:DNA repair protein RecO (recombination protein O)